MVLRSSRQPRRLSWIEDSRGLLCKAYASLPYSLANLPSCTPVFGIFPENTTFQTQVINLGLKTGSIAKGYPFSDGWLWFIKRKGQASAQRGGTSQEVR